MIKIFTIISTIIILSLNKKIEVNFIPSNNYCFAMQYKKINSNNCDYQTKFFSYIEEKS